MSPWFQKAGLPAAAVVLVAAVLGIQLAHGGGAFEPLHSADPCAARQVASVAPGIDGLSERLVLLGVDGAACRLGISREALTLRLAEPGGRTDAEIDALHQGLLGAVQRMKDDDTLPPASDLLDEALDAIELNGFLKAAIRALPDGVVDAALRTDDILVRTVDGLDLRALLENLDSPDDLDRQIEVAVTQAVKDSVVDRVRNLV